MTRRFCLFLCTAFALSAQTSTVWKQVWSDEFNAASGSPPDSSKWNFDLGNNNGWGNGELENYTNSAQNAFQDGKGNLVIRAIRDSAGSYTSARLQTGSPGASTHTADGNWQYGRIAARIKLPFGQGVWPAFWMLGENFVTAGWPTCGELDIMENFGTFHDNSNVNNGTAHGPGYSGGAGISKSYMLPRGQRVYDDYHVYSIEWAPDSVEWFVDGVSFHKVTPASLPKGARWVFNAPFFILLNLAVGGPKTFLGTPDPNAAFPRQDMLVDYVRVYQAAPAVAGAPAIMPGGVVNAAWSGHACTGHPRRGLRGGPRRHDDYRHWHGPFSVLARRCFRLGERRRGRADLRFAVTDRFSDPVGDAHLARCRREGAARNRRKRCRDGHDLAGCSVAVPA